MKAKKYKLSVQGTATNFLKDIRSGNWPPAAVYWGGFENAVEGRMKAPKRTLYVKEGPYSAKSARIWFYRLQMHAVAIECLGSFAAAKAFAREPAFALQGRVPWLVCVSKKGLQECVTALRRIDYNIAS